MVPAESETAWDKGVTRRFAGLALVRVVAQVIGLVWFLAAARGLSDVQYGLLATGLTFFAIFAGVGDLGTTRGVVRHVAATPRLLRPVYLRASALRILGGAAAGVLGICVVAVATDEISPAIIALAGAAATASGATELAYAALRCIGHVKVEMVLLVAERIAFLMLGLVALDSGAGAVGLLGVYLATNTVSAVVGLLAVLHFARSPAFAEANVTDWSLTDPEARFTAVSFTLVTVSPRIAPALLSLLTSATAVGIYSVAQRPIEALTLFALSSAAPLFPMVRERIATDRRESATNASSEMVAAIAVALAPLLSWFVVSPVMVLELLFGPGRYAESAMVLRLLAITCLTWSFRGVAELVLLAEERAREFLNVMGIGILATVGFALATAGSWKPSTAAWSVVVSEVTMTILLARLVPSLVARAACRKYAVVVAVGGMTTVPLVLARESTPTSLIVATGASLGGAFLAFRSIRSIEVRI